MFKSLMFLRYNLEKLSSQTQNESLGQPGFIKHESLFRLINRSSYLFILVGRVAKEF